MYIIIKTLIVLTCIIVVSILFRSSAYAHGFGERYDLPIPLNYFLIGAAATVALSFAIISWFIRQGTKQDEYPRFNLYKWGPVRSVCRWGAKFIGLFSVLLLILTVFAGLFGTSKALDNFAPTFVWIIWWVGISYLVALLGNIWAIANPLQVFFEWLENVFGKQEKPRVNWPKRLDAWPSLTLFLLFAWVENVYIEASRPFNLAILILLYSLVTLVGMVLFGKYVWLKNGDPFSVLFALFARFSPTEVRITKSETGTAICSICVSKCADKVDLPDCVDCYECWERADEGQKHFSVRPWAMGLSRGEKVTPALMAFHVTALATVTFDGLSETPAWVWAKTTLWPIIDPLPGQPMSTIESLGLLIIPTVFALAYIQICNLVSMMSGNQMSGRDVVMSFVFALVPIALAYNLSHYLSFLMISGQQIVPLISNPLGLGWDIFGSADYRPNIAIIDARFAWVVSVTAIVTGHILSVLIAHIISLRRTANHSIAVRSQYPMLALMVFYTAISLWIIAQPIVD